MVGLFIEKRVPEQCVCVSVYVCVCVCVCAVAQSCLAVSHPVDCSPPDSSIHGVLQVRTLEWVAIFFYRGSSRPRDQTRISHIAGSLYHLSHQGSYVITLK